MNEKLDGLKEVQKKLLARLEKVYGDITTARNDVSKAMNDLAEMILHEEKEINRELEDQAQEFEGKHRDGYQADKNDVLAETK